jgi:hypothetical protein
MKIKVILKAQDYGMKKQHDEDYTKMSKVNREYFNELSEVNKKIVKQLGDNISLSDLAWYIDKNWRKITGESAKDRFEESYFPRGVEDLIEYYGFDENDFSQEWIYVAEAHS